MKLPKESYCGIKFGNSSWQSHTMKCDICKSEIERIISEENILKQNWDRECKCGCGDITKYGKEYIVHHHTRNKKQTDEHKSNKLKSWKKNGNSEKMSKRLIENNPSSSEKSKIRMKENNPAKTADVKEKLSKNNAMHNPEYRERARVNKNEKNGDYSMAIDKMKKTMIDRYGVDNPAKVKEIIERRVDTYTKRQSEGKYEIKNNWICGRYLRKNGETEWHDSSFELRKMIQYDTDGIIWTKKHGIRISYVNETGLNSFYVPDFLIEINNNKIIVETKGYVKEADILKAESCIDWCKNNNYQYYFLLGENLEIVDKYSYICKYIEYI